MFPTQHADALRIEVASVEVSQLVPVGTIPGVAVLNAAARNGPGQGRLRSERQTVGTLISWRAPGSNTFGTAHRVEADGIYVLADGEDPSKFVRCEVWTAYLCPGACQGRVALRDVYNNAVGEDDAASGGDETAYTVDLQNDGTVILSQLKVWLDGAVDNLWISDDGVAWVQPITEAAALALPDLAAGASDTLHIKRLFAAEAAAPDVLNLLHVSFFAL